MTSGKKAKEERKANKLKAKLEVTIKVFDDGNVSVEGFPNQHQAAMTLMQTAVWAVSQQFVNHARNGELSATGCIKRSPIVLPGGKTLVLPGQ